MVASQKKKGTYEVTRSDPAWDAILHDCRALGGVAIQSGDGETFTLLPPPIMPATRSIRALPDFEARFRAMWPDGRALNESEAADLDRMIAGE